ncbi:MAG: hypothetical protein PHN45_09545 [Methylococcales bacterium]|nr:hypothetical protein [Methylococcales bacterium]MDD5754984.1 hypothetical protein [Methylococcales bacterium]
MKTRRLFLVSFLIVVMSMLTGWRSHHHHSKHHVEQQLSEISEPKMLDLSLPLQIENKFDAPITQAKSDFVVEKSKKIQREVELDTQAIMSIEPEQDKIKSFDGAALTINVKR